jgi:quercetin dioxygenase-like cupin family protein
MAELPINAQAINAQASSEPRLTESTAFSLDHLPVKTTPNGGKSWNILHGTLATGETIAIHESQQPAGTPPNPPHQIRHSEFIFVREGTLEFQHDGKSERVSAGGVIFVAYNTLHSARNVADGPATYCVIAIGGDTK